MESRRSALENVAGAIIAVLVIGIAAIALVGVGIKVADWAFGG